MDISFSGWPCVPLTAIQLAETVENIVCQEFTLGRRFMGRLPRGQDLITAIEGFCQARDIQMAAFTVTGALSSVTLGAFDQQQQVYVTEVHDEPLSLVAGQGNVSVRDTHPFVYVSAVLSDTDGQTIGGRLFTRSIIFAGELDLQELTGPPLKRHYDATTGLLLWK